MPRVETRYYCDVCGKYYMKKESAVECEKSHLIPESVNGADYAKDDRKNQYPDSVLVHFKGGKSAKYYRMQR